MLRNLWHVPDAQLNWQATLTAAWFGLGDPYRAWRRGELATLGAHEMDLIVLAGDIEDLPRLRKLVESNDLDSRVLRLLARFGHLAVVPVLLFGLKDDELQDAAADALELLLGPRLDADARLDPAAWQKEIASMPLRSDLRVWHGEPFRPSILAREFDRGYASLVELEQYLEEIRVRTCRVFPTSLHGWHAANQGRIGRIRDDLRHFDAMYPTGSWSCAIAVAD
jgi:hypothetical protein